MSKSTLAGIISAFLFCLLVGGGVYFLLPPSPPLPPKSTPAKKKIIKPKLAFTTDPKEAMERGEQAEKEGKWEEAISWYRLAGNNLPRGHFLRGYVRYRQAYCRYQLGEYLTAKNILEWALNHYPNMPHLDDALFLMAQIYTKLGDFEKAYKTYNTIIRMFPPRKKEAKERQSNLPYSP